VTPIYIQVTLDLLTVVLSASVTLVIIGVRWGRLETQVTELQKDIAEIKGMFVLRLRE
jgi:hypothetical protein